MRAHICPLFLSFLGDEARTTGGGGRRTLMAVIRKQPTTTSAWQRREWPRHSSSMNEDEVIRNPSNSHCWLAIAFILPLIIAGPLCAAARDPEQQQGVHYEKYEIASAGCALHLVAIDTSRYTLRVIDNGPSLASPTYASVKEAARRNGCFAGINGGFFDMERFTPCGLMIAQGRMVSPLERQSWQEGLFVVRGNRPVLMEREAFTSAEGVSDALQSGPWLIRGGVLEDPQKKDVRRMRRVFLVQG